MTLPFSLGSESRQAAHVMSTAAVEYSTMMVIASSWQAECTLLKERKGKERKGKERKGKERKGKERKGKERKGKERQPGALTWLNSTIDHQPFLAMLGL